MRQFDLKNPAHIVSIFAVAFILISIPLTIVLSLQSEKSANPPKAQAATRDKYTKPFASNSIWNLPIGANATYVPAKIQNANAWRGEITIDEEFIGTNPNDPIRTVNGIQVHVPAGMSHDGGWNGCATFVRASDKDTLISGQPLVMSSTGSGSWQYNYSNPFSGGGDMSMTGEGRFGCHGGSAMSGVGGSLRKGELLGTAPISHALKINLFAQRFLSCSNNGYRWPAFRADGYMSCSTYAGTVTQARMGSLFALKPDVNCDTTVTSAGARKICKAFQNYGGYVVDDTAWDVHALNVSSDSADEFFSQGGTFHSDVQKLFTLLHVVDNWNQSLYNTVASSNGAQGAGGGTPKVCWSDGINGTVYPCNGGGGSGDTTNPLATLTAPANGATVSGTSVSLSANASDNVGVTQVQFFVNNQSVGTDNTSPYSIPWNSTTITNGTYSVFARAFDAAGNQGNSPSISITVNNQTNPPPPPPSLPSPWITSDIGAVGLTGSASYSNGIFTVSGAGDDIWDTVDSFRYVYQDLTGNGSIVARVTSQTNTDPWAKAGVMIRETTAVGSKHALMFVSPSNGVAFQYRTTTDGITSHSGGSGTVPVWVRLTRNGTTFTGAVSTDGQTFTQIGTATISMTSTVKIGLVSLSHNTNALSQSSFSAVTVTSGTVKTGDTNSDGKVDTLDLSYLLSKWGSSDSLADINKDGSVNILDLSGLLANWG